MYNFSYTKRHSIFLSNLFSLCLTYEILFDTNTHKNLKGPRLFFIYTIGKKIQCVCVHNNILRIILRNSWTIYLTSYSSKTLYFATTLLHISKMSFSVSIQKKMRIKSIEHHTKKFEHFYVHKNENIVKGNVIGIFWFFCWFKILFLKFN